MLLHGCRTGISYVFDKHIGSSRSRRRKTREPHYENQPSMLYILLENYRDLGESNIVDCVSFITSSSCSAYHTFHRTYSVIEWTLKRDSAILTELLRLCTLLLHTLASTKSSSDLLDLSIALGRAIAVGACGLHGVDTFLLV